MHAQQKSDLLLLCMAKQVGVILQPYTDTGMSVLKTPRWLEAKQQELRMQQRTIVVLT